MTILHCQDFFSTHFLNLVNKDKFCNSYWYAMQKCATLAESITLHTMSKIAFRCAIVARREKKCRWPEVEFIIGQSRYASGLYYDYMQRLHERGVLGKEELEQIRSNMDLGN